MLYIWVVCHQSAGKKNFKDYLKNDYQCVIFKENREDWMKAEIVVTTIQSLLVNDKYKKMFSILLR